MRQENPEEAQIARQNRKDKAGNQRFRETRKTVRAVGSLSMWLLSVELFGMGDPSLRG